MQRLGLTGSIATGKSTILAMFAELGAMTFSADQAVHDLYERATVPGIERLFAGIVVNSRIERAQLARRLQAEPEKLADLEALVHPLVRDAIARFYAGAPGLGKNCAIAEIPLLFESGHDYHLDATIVASCSPATQRRRALARKSMTEEKFQTLLRRQMPMTEKIARATYVIDTEGTIEVTRQKVAELFAEICQDGPKNAPGAAK